MDTISTEEKGQELPWTFIEYSQSPEEKEVGYLKVSAEKKISSTQNYVSIEIFSKC